VLFCKISHSSLTSPPLPLNSSLFSPLVATGPLSFSPSHIPRTRSPRSSAKILLPIFRSSSTLSPTQLSLLPPPLTLASTVVVLFYWTNDTSHFLERLLATPSLQFFPLDHSSPLPEGMPLLPPAFSPYVLSYMDSLASGDNDKPFSLYPFTVLPFPAPPLPPPAFFLPKVLNYLSSLF